MGRLINADNLNAEFADIITGLENRQGKETISREEFCECLKALRECVDEQPTAYDPEKVVEQLEKASVDLFGKRYQRALALWEATEIVRKGGV